MSLGHRLLRHSATIGQHQPQQQQHQLQQQKQCRPLTNRSTASTSPLFPLLSFLSFTHSSFYQIASCLQCSSSSPFQFPCPSAQCSLFSIIPFLYSVLLSVCLCLSLIPSVFCIYFCSICVPRLSFASSAPRLGLLLQVYFLF